MAQCVASVFRSSLLIALIFSLRMREANDYRCIEVQSTVRSFFPRRLLSCSQLFSEEVSSCSRRVIIISPSDFAIDSEMYQSSLDEAAKSYALEYLGESEEVAAASVLEIQKFLTDNPEINAHADPRSILCFLRSCKFNVEQTKIRIKR